jgi:hypothetical protein
VTELAPVSEGDSGRLAAFLADFPGETKDIAYWGRRLRLWWEDNPAFDQRVSRGWVLLDDGGRIGGFLGNIPALFKLNRREERAFGATTWRVTPALRTSSVHLYLAHLEASRGALAFNTTANANVARVLAYLKFRMLRSHPSGRVFLVPVKGKAVATGYLRGRNLPGAVVDGAAIAARIATAPLEALARVVPRDVRVLRSAEGCFDDLWERTRDRYANTSVRTASQVRWRFFSEHSPRVVLGAFHKGRLRGYAAFERTSWRDVRTLAMIDLWTEPENEGHIVQSLVAEAWDFARKSGHELLALYDYAEHHATLFRRIGVLATSSEPRVHHYRTGEDGSGDMVPGVSYLTSLEGDRSL